MKDFSANIGDIAAQMEVNGLSCTLNMPPAVKGEGVASLPPYAPRKVFKVDEYECPANWMHGSALESSYFTPVEAEKGMWLDFNKCNSHKHHVAVLISVQGVNPLTGQSQVEGKPLCLEQYKTKCPKHDIDFQQDRFCEKCGYKWVPQNYLATTSTPSGRLWLDGFLAEDGVVRQYYFTEEEAKGVAHQIVGADKKVFAIGVAFYLSKTPKPVVEVSNCHYDYSDMLVYGKPMHYVDKTYLTGYYDSHQNWSCDTGKAELLKSVCRSAKRGVGGQSAVDGQSSNVIRTQGLGAYEAPVTCNEVDDGDVQTSFDIGAGAKIDQKIYVDNESLDFWEEKPVGFVYINYCSIKQAKAILKKKKEILKDGWLTGCVVGNK